MKKTLILLFALTTWLTVKAQPEHSFEVSKNLDVLNTLYRQLDLFYVDTLDANKLIRVGIDAMLEELDPYTVYYPEEDMGDLKMMTTGKYGGLGAYIRMRKDSTIIILEPFADSPAAEMGLKVGDILLQIDEKQLKGMNTSEVSDLLRGEPGTTFLLKVQRPGEKKVRNFRITRQSIKRAAIPYHGLKGDVGYICLTEFTEGCAKDLRKAVISLKEKGAKSIVIDLRNNGGGLLNEAVDIVNLFVPKGLKIVETRGKTVMAQTTYITRNDPLDLDIPLVILVNDDTASASEIVAGALQDLDRAVVIGSKTFGKGLVQSPRELPYNGNLKLTTAKYYIPSGRCIQKVNYKQKREDAEVYRQTGKIVNRQDSALQQVFHTAGGREVTEGSGIKPDIEVKRDTLPSVVFYLSRDSGDELIDWATSYAQAHPTIPAVQDFAITDDDYNSFKQQLKDHDFKYDQQSVKRLEDLKKTIQFEGYYDDAKEALAALEQKLVHNLDKDLDRHQQDIRRLMANEVVRRYYLQAGAVEQSLKNDEDFEAALQLLHNPKDYNNILGKKND